MTGRHMDAHIQSNRAGMAVVILSGIVLLELGVITALLINRIGVFG